MCVPCERASKKAGRMAKFECHKKKRSKILCNTLANKIKSRRVALYLMFMLAYAKKRTIDSLPSHKPLLTPERNGNI